MTTDDRPTIAERYSTASSTSDLRVREGACDADILIASGMAKGPGALLIRLRSEWDQAHAEVTREAAGQNIGTANHRMLVMMRLQSLKTAKEVVRVIYMERNLCDAGGVNEPLCWQALSSWLDPTCGHCSGRGFNGGYDGPKIQCRHCDGGNRRGFMGRDDWERQMVKGIQLALDEAVASHAGQVSRRLRG